MIEVFGYTFGALAILAIVGVCVIAMVIGALCLASRYEDD